MTTDATTAKADLMARLLRAERRLAEIEAAASEAVTEDVKQLARAAFFTPDPDSPGDVGGLDAALLAVAPALVLAGERRGLERAEEIAKRRKDALQAAHAKDPDNLALDARRIEAFGTWEELRALGRPA